jgi:hypothetical protein
VANAIIAAVLEMKLTGEWSVDPDELLACAIASVAADNRYTAHGVVAVLKRFGRPADRRKREGRCYIGSTYGHNMKSEMMARAMAEVNPGYWGASLYRWFIFGHIHHETVKRVGSVYRESFSQPVPGAAYARTHFPCARCQGNVIDDSARRRRRIRPPHREFPESAALQGGRLTRRRRWPRTI